MHSIDSDQEDSEEDIKKFGVFRVAIYTATITSINYESEKADTTAEEYTRRSKEEEEILCTFTNAAATRPTKLPEARKKTLSESAV